MEDVLMRFADTLALRSTCLRQSVGCVVTDSVMLRVLGVGYNGNARGLPNCCDHPDDVGACGCLHAELNALLKASGSEPAKQLFTTLAPCAACAKMIVNAGVERVVYGVRYRLTAGLEILDRSGIRTVCFDVPAAERRIEAALARLGKGGSTSYEVMGIRKTHP
jgi:dCMP deaminase